MKRSLFVFLCTSISAFAAGHLAVNEKLQAAVDDLYESHFEASRQTLIGYSAEHPEEPLPYSMQAASYFFAELEKGGALDGDLLGDEKKARRRAPYKPDKTAADAMSQAVKRARASAGAKLARQPDDRDALLAMCIVAGLQRDYLALVEHKMRESYVFIRESNDYAKRLLKTDPTAYDAYLTKGFTEYLVASLPFYLRWMMNADDLKGTRDQGLSDMQIAAQSGQYLKPFAQLMLATFYLREKREDKTEELLGQLTERYPANKIFRAEFIKLRRARKEASFTR